MLSQACDDGVILRINNFWVSRMYTVPRKFNITI